MSILHRPARLLPLLGVALLAACLSSGPEKTLNALAEALSGNDSKSFMGHVDFKAYAANEISNMTQENRLMGFADSLGRKLGIGGVDRMLNSIVDVENELRQQFLRGVSTGELVADCTQATYPDCPWVPESLRKAKVKKLNDTAAVASVTTPAGITSWLALQKRGDEWVVVGQAALEDTARKYALGTAARPERDGGAPSGQGRGQEGVNI
ncbi:hypothetical protein [uncultured Desulfovibrio sp.]|uniref:Lipoprotein n=1 Tax=Candidatus Desulfovibrio intestinavium TaxID=2838534 RepID=A0A9D2KRG4_9BACT|nr:hypothetical protein [uncultured Desulfovibrio sp.]HJA78840.1 hypothetical protein [Candidatus Desulfovibrio intestinavium]